VRSAPARCYTARMRFEQQGGQVDQSLVDAGKPRCRPGTSDRLVRALRERTRVLHRQAERSGMIAKILSGHASAREYMHLLRNLLPAYAAMERQLKDLPAGFPFAVIADRQLFRAQALRKDLLALAGPGWPAIALTPAARAYADLKDALGSQRGWPIIAHAYTRYLGDLSGGQILQRILVQKLRLAHDQTNFYRFELPCEPGGFRTRYIDALNGVLCVGGDMDSIVEEAAIAFQMNIRLSDELSCGTHSVD
jgi:heme oxygenase